MDADQTEPDGHSAFDQFPGLIRVEPRSSAAKNVFFVQGSQIDGRPWVKCADM
jgi:hypothetical protein